MGGNGVPSAPSWAEPEVQDLPGTQLSEAALHPGAHGALAC